MLQATANIENYLWPLAPVHQNQSCGTVDVKVNANFRKCCALSLAILVGQFLVIFRK